MMVEAFSGVLSGAAFGSSVGSMYKHLDRKQDVGHFFCLFDIDAFIEVPLFKQRIDAMIDQVKACKKRPGVAEILVPGERSHRVRRQNLQQGVSIDPATLAELRELCRQLEISFTLDPIASD
jgi:LDH2 family malate/lactate/ureidoglycolate dehydrogenase